MPVHIDQVVTEIFTEAESESDEEAVDKRWSEQIKVEAFLKQTERHNSRLKAEGFDD